MADAAQKGLGDKTAALAPHDDQILVVAMLEMLLDAGLVLHVQQRYAQRMWIENNIEDGIHVFHMDALSSAVAIKVNCDVQLTLMASSLYRYLGQRIGHGYETVKSQHLFGDFIDAPASLYIGDRDLVVRFPRRAPSPYLVAAGFDQTDLPFPWIGRRRLQFQFA